MPKASTVGWSDGLGGICGCAAKKPGYKDKREREINADDQDEATWSFSEQPTDEWNEKEPGFANS